MEYSIKRGLATLKKLDSDCLTAFNTENGTKHVKLFFEYVEEEGDKKLSPLDLVLSKCNTSNNVYNVIIDLSGLDRDGLEALKNAVDNNKTANFSTVICTISQITDGKYTSVSNDTRAYSSLSNSYIGIKDEEFLKQSAISLKARLFRQVSDDNNEMKFDALVDASKPEKKKDAEEEKSNPFDFGL